MKCPKCQYLGFETGDRCRNCGYDFSLLEFRSPVERDALLAQAPGPGGSTDEAWDSFDADLDAPITTDASLNFPPASDQSAEPALPLFALTAEDQPLVRLPVTPRRPLAVRRTPEHPQLRSTSRSVPIPEPTLPVDSALDFPEEAALPHSADRLPRTEDTRNNDRPRVPSPAALLLHSSSPQRRCVAACIDYALLLGIDTTIVYFTVRMAGLDMSDWRLLPMVPLALFLGVIALAYVGVFTAVGGQTIGKMAARIRVVSDDPVPVGAVHAFKRTAAVGVSWLTGGLGFLPALVGEHRALHDRLSRTRVVDLA